MRGEERQKHPGFYACIGVVYASLISCITCFSPGRLARPILVELVLTKSKELGKLSKKGLLM